MIALFFLSSIDHGYWNHYKLTAQSQRKRQQLFMLPCLCVVMLKGINSKISKVHVNSTNKQELKCRQKPGDTMHINVSIKSVIKINIWY